MVHACMQFNIYFSSPHYTILIIRGIWHKINGLTLPHSAHNIYKICFYGDMDFYVWYCRIL